MTSEKNDKACDNPICLTCIEERAYFCRVCPELTAYHNFACSGCFDKIMETFDRRKFLPPVTIEEEEEPITIDTLSSLELGRLIDVPLPHSSKKEGKELARCISKEVKKGVKDELKKLIAKLATKSTSTGQDVKPSPKEAPDDAKNYVEILNPKKPFPNR